MNYTENFEGIKLDVQAGDINISDELQQEIRDAIGRLKRHISEVNFVDVYDVSGATFTDFHVTIHFSVNQSSSGSSNAKRA